MGFRRTVILSLLLAGTLTASSVVEDRRAVATIRAGTAALTNAEKEDFLRTAQPLAWETLPVGTTVWVIDFTRAFRIDHEIEREELGGRVGRSLYRAMRDLDEDTLLAEIQTPSGPPGDRGRPEGAR